MHSSRYSSHFLVIEGFFGGGHFRGFWSKLGGVSGLGNTHLLSWSPHQHAEGASSSGVAQRSLQSRSAQRARGVRALLAGLLLLAVAVAVAALVVLVFVCFALLCFVLLCFTLFCSCSVFFAVGVVTGSANAWVL